MRGHVPLAFEYQNISFRSACLKDLIHSFMNLFSLEKFSSHRDIFKPPITGSLVDVYNSETTFSSLVRFATFTETFP